MILSEGKVPTIQGALWTAKEPTRVQVVTLHNTSGTPQTCVVFIRRAGRDPRRVKSYAFTLNQGATPIGEVDFNKGDSIEAVTTTDGVDFSVQGVAIKDLTYLVHGAFQPQKWDSDGAPMNGGGTGGTGGGGGTTGYISAGTQIGSLGTMVFSNSNNVTFGMSGSSRITAAAAITFSAGSTQVTIGSTRSLVFADGGGVTFGLNGSTITASVAPSGGAQTGISGIAASNTTYTSGSVTFRDLNGISWGTTTGQQIQITHALQFTSNTSAITSNAVNTSDARIQGVIGSNTTYTSGSVSLRDLNGITWQSTTGQAFQITHALQFTSNTSAITSNALNTSASRVINILAATNSTGGGIASLSSNVSFLNANGLSFFTSTGNAIVGSYTTPTQSNQTGGIYVSAATTSGDSSSSTYDLRSLTVTLGGGLIGGWTNGSLLLLNNNNIVFSAGATSNSLTRLGFSNSNNISFGLAAGTNSTRLTASYAFNISAGTTSSDINGVTFSDANGVKFGFDGTNITANAGYLSYYENQPWLVATGAMTQGNSTAAIVPFNMPLPGSFSYLRIPNSCSTNSTTQTATTNSSFGFSGSILSTLWAVVYSLGTGASSRSLQSVASGSCGISQQISMSVSSGLNGSGTRWSVTQKITYPQEGATNLTFSATTAQSSGVLGVNTEGTNSDFNLFKHIDIPFANSLSAGAYWLAFGRSSTTSTQSLAFITGAKIDHSNVCATQPNVTFGLLGAANSSSNQLQLGIGSYTTNAMTTASIALSQISSSASHLHPYFQLIRQA